MKRFFDMVFKDGKTILFSIGVAFTLIAPFIVGVAIRDANTTWVVALCGAFVTLLARFDDLLEVSLGPLKARMRESINEANATLEQLRALAASVAHYSFTELIAGRFLGGMSMRDRLAMHSKMVSDLLNLGVSDSQIREAQSGWRKGIGMVYHHIVRSCLEGRRYSGDMGVTVPEQVEAVSRELQALVRFESWAIPTPDEMEQLISARGMMTDPIREWIDDYRHFLATNEIRRVETFLAYLKH